MDRIGYLKQRKIPINEIEQKIVLHLSKEKFCQYVFLINEYGRKTSFFVFNMDWPSNKTNGKNYRICELVQKI